MKFLTTTAAILALSSTVNAAPLMLTPADPQPEGLSEGLAVSYASGAGGRTLEEAKSKLSRAKPGVPLRGLSYLDTDEGDRVLTSEEATKVAAAITGFVNFEAAGTFTIDFFSNDGLEAMIGGQLVGFADETRSCDPTGPVEVEVPVAGWYALEATYFQRKGSACLMMDWDASGEMEPTPDTAFGYAD